VRIVWATIQKRNYLVGAAKDEPAQLIQTAQELVDNSAIWRKASLSNCDNLFLLYFLLIMEGRPEAHYYLSAASSQFRQLFRSPSDLVGDDGNYVWFAYRFALVVCLLALETGSPPLLYVELPFSLV
jgi:hypothetical protein